MIQERILELVKYGLTTGLVDPADEGACIFNQDYFANY